MKVRVQNLDSNLGESLRIPSKLFPPRWRADLEEAVVAFPLLEKLQREAALVHKLGIQNRARALH